MVMSYICPVCNGLSTLQSTCPKCHHTLDDHGRLDDIWEPYAPYREYDDMKLTNGFPDDYSNHLCVHITSCPNCQTDAYIPISEQFYP